MTVALIVLLVVIIVALLAGRGGRRATADEVPPAARHELPPRAFGERAAGELAKAMIAGRGVEFQVDVGRGARALSVRFVVLPLDALDRPTARGDGLDTREWHVWQSLTGRGCVTRLPLQVSEVADALGIRGTVAEEALRRLAHAHNRLAYVH